MEKELEYEVTCYKDKNNVLGGKLYLNDNTYLDFDRDMVFINGESKKVSQRRFDLLKAVIVNTTIHKDILTLIQEELSGKPKKSSNEFQELKNFQTYVNQLLNVKIVERRGEYFLSNLKKTIKKFNDIEKKDVYSIKELFPEAYGYPKKQDKVETAPVKVDIQANGDFASYKFLNPESKQLIKRPVSSCFEEISKLSKVFDPISKLDNESGTDIINQLYQLISNEMNSSHKEILRIQGSIGSYKNKIMQYLYVAVSKKNKKAVPYYIDVSYYELIKDSDTSVTDDQIIASLNADFDKISLIYKERSEKTPLLFLDGIKEFSPKNAFFYHEIKKRIQELNCKLVICIDADFTINDAKIISEHPLDSQDYLHYMRIKPMSLYIKSEAIDFIESCIQISNINEIKELSSEKIYNNLMRLNVSEFDAYWLIYILNTNAKSFFDPKYSSVTDIYTKICTDMIGSVKLR